MGDSFRMETDAARACAATFLRFADTLDPQLQRSASIQTLSGFGGFDSALQLRRGFESKARELTETLGGLGDLAVRMAAAYLLAAGVIAESDQSCSRALLAATAGLDSPG
ncbi:hypothetical protein [Nocardia jejuensis]|uniref:hypothetical protein n=1 Tax=Nocardia jejuensis TaxID=328049 RepID=UPI00082CCEF9|nr:hypothetical protein [Nocardia jejuensis]